MIIDCLKPGAQRGTVYDDGLGRRIPFVRWANLDTGEYVALEEEHDGSASGRQYRGRAVGRLRFVPQGNAFVIKRPLTENEKLMGLEQYRKLFFDVYKFRENANKHIAQDWSRKHGRRRLH